MEDDFFLAKYNFLYLEAPVFTRSHTLGENVVIKGVDEDAYRRLKSRASKEGLKIGQAASIAFKAWAQQGEGRLNQRRIRDADRMKAAAEVIDSNRVKLKQVEDWSSVKVIRKWRQNRRT